METNLIGKNIDSCLYVSEDVLAKVISRAAESVDGVHGIARSAKNPLRLLFAKENHGKMKFRLDAGVLSVALGVILESGAPAMECAEKIQENVKDQVQNILGLTVAHVSVKVIDVV